MKKKTERKLQGQGNKHQAAKTKPSAGSATQPDKPSPEPTIIAELKKNEQTATDTVESSTEEVAEITVPTSRPMDEDAHAWMVNAGSIPQSGYAPFQFLGWLIIEILSTLLRRPLTLAEVKLLIRADGGITRCAATNTVFQPVAYWPFVPQNVRDALSKGTPLADIKPDFMWAGAFFVDGDKRMVFAVSGPKYGKFGRKFCKPSLLFKTAALKAKARAQGDERSSHRLLWGMCRGEQEDFLKTREAEREGVRKAVSNLEALVFGSRGRRDRNTDHRNRTQPSDAGHRNGNHRNIPETEEVAIIRA